MKETMADKKPDNREIMADYNQAVKFFHETPAEAWEALGQKAALDIFQETKEIISGYGDFLKDHHFSGDIDSMENFAKIPTMDKYSYILKYGFNEVNSVKAGQNLYSFSLSSGTSDEPTIWPRYYAYEEYVLPLVIDFYMRLYWKIDQKTTLLVNALDLGPWMAGLTLHTGFKVLTQKYNVTLATPGSDQESVVQTIKKLGKYYDQVILWAYPTFARTIMDKLIEAKINLKDLNFKLFVGAEGHTIEWWQYVNKMLGGSSDEHLTRIMDGYGVSEAGLVGLGSALSNLIRVLCQKDLKLRKAVFGKVDSVPDILQYNPASYYIEEINGELLFTSKSATPIVRYNIHDRGGIIKFREMEKILADHGYDYKKLLKKDGISEDTVWQQPFVYCCGRGKETVSVSGAIVLPEQVSPLFFTGKEKEVHSFKLNSSFDKDLHQIFNIFIELKYGIEPDQKQLEKMEKRYHDLILRQLKKVNLDYASAWKNDSKVADPVICVYLNGTGPFAHDTEKTKTRFVG
jgi:phenylacetate-CoA ligase